MIGNKKKRIEITLSIEDLELLNSLSLRFDITKSNVIKQALRVFASRRKHYYIVSLKETQESHLEELNQVKEPDDPNWEKKWDEMMKKMESSDEEKLIINEDND